MNSEFQEDLQLDRSVLLESLDKIAYTLDKAYISELSKEYKVYPFDQYNKDEIVCHVNNIRVLKVNRWVFDKSEKPGDCFKNVLTSFADGDHSIAMVLVRKPSSTEMYFVVKCEGEARNDDSRNNLALLNSSITGNFPGTMTTEIAPESAEKLFSLQSLQSVAVLVNNPSEYSEDYITQRIDKLLNGIVPEKEEDSFVVVFLAESVSSSSIQDILSGIEDISTAMYPYKEFQFTVSKDKSGSYGAMTSITESQSITDSISKTHSVNVNASIGFPIKVVDVNIGGGYGYSYGKSHSESHSEQKTEGNNWSVSSGISNGATFSYKSYKVSDLLEKAEKTIDKISHSRSIGLWKFATYVLAGDAKTSKNIASYLNALTQGKESYTEASVIQEWSKKTKATDLTDDDGAFDSIRDYVINFTHPVFYPRNGFFNNNDTQYYEMMITPTSYVSTDEVANTIAFPRKSVAGLPVFECAEFGRNIVTYDQVYISEKGSINRSNVHSSENAVLDNPEFYLGSIFHMNQIEENNAVALFGNSLSSHTFITGSTGSGKSNTVYQMLLGAMKQKTKIPFLVIEPAKGEYKHVFCENSAIWCQFSATERKELAVNVYGTNPRKTPLLRLNPFSFPENIHVLEHIDRLVEIFNVCWPMYAAMPAVLKNAVEKAYVDCGWDLIKSNNSYGNTLFPSFVDVARNVKTIIDSSEYDAENKGAYKGSLLTRLQSLTNGINGMILCQDELDSKELFEKNVIIDLSRVGATETKSLLMGILVLKLQEYRMDSGPSKSNLRHITVLEEAHHLLKRSSSMQITEGSNLLGKSVEMLSNAIAEMRSQGEGFIIADQSPGLLDMSAIRNTNTKIILRLPEQTDRELVGKAAGLNDYQVAELAKLPRGVAAVYQNDWIQAVLCQVKEVEVGNSEYQFEIDNNDTQGINLDERLKIAIDLSYGRKMKKEECEKEISTILNDTSLSAYTKVRILKYYESPPREPRMTKIAPIICDLFPEVRIAIANKYDESSRPSEWTHAVETALQSYRITKHKTGLRVWNNIIQAIITDVIINERNKINDMKRWCEEGGLR